MGRELTAGITTKTDVVAREWSLTDDVIRLRDWATDRIRSMPPLTEACLIGSSGSCGIRLDDPHVSREHARLFHDGSAWWVRDLGSKNGVRESGIQTPVFQLKPLTEIGIGGVTFIAESGRSIALRGFLRRVLGWGSDRTEEADVALRAMRLAAAHRSALALCGAGDLVPLAFSLHRHSLPAGRPFVLADPARQDGEASIRNAANFRSGLDAFEAATGGTLCIRTQRPPSDFARVLKRFRDPHAGVQLILCSRTRSEAERTGCLSIQIPPLKDRAEELSRVVHEYAEDACSVLAAPARAFVRSDRDWVLQHAAKSLPEIETTTLRLVALRSSGNVAGAAERLGMAATSLADWITRRKLPQHLELLPQ
jgi:hypothetical protein